MVCRVNALRFHIPTAYCGYNLYHKDMHPFKTWYHYASSRTDATKKDQGGAGRRKLLSNAENVMWRRVLAGSGGDDFCTKNVRF